MTVEQLLAGTQRFDYPADRQINITLKRAPKAPPREQQPPLFEGARVSRAAKMAKAALPERRRTRRA